MCVVCGNMKNFNVALIGTFTYKQYIEVSEIIHQQNTTDWWCANNKLSDGGFDSDNIDYMGEEGTYNILITYDKYDIRRIIVRNA